MREAPAHQGSGSSSDKLCPGTALAPASVSLVPELLQTGFGTPGACCAPGARCRWCFCCWCCSRSFCASCSCCSCCRCSLKGGGSTLKRRPSSPGRMEMRRPVCPDGTAALA
jgi:hypothetical protein